ncbi:MAG: hypothetical protein JXR25_14890 [Pontiellaceae bacterium]|nr:hypothetical protein [Pontiellaceae bacterium]MBN2786106.1 hypothetical protein [Pontiellaceae bacterium]
MKVELGKEKDGYHAKILGRKHLTAFGFTKREALEDLLGAAAEEFSDDKDYREAEKKIQEQLKKLDDA